MSRSQRKRKIVSAIMASLLLVSSAFVYGSSSTEVKGASFNRITKITKERGGTGPDYGGFYNIETVNGDIYAIKSDQGLLTVQATVSNAVKSVNSGQAYLDRDGYVWRYKAGVYEKINNNKFTDLTYFAAKDAAVTYFALGTDGKVTAWGENTDGQAGVGYKAAIAATDYVVDPNTVDDPLENVKKIFKVSRGTVILVTDSTVYMLGMGFGSTSMNYAKPIKLSGFPAFTSADDFDFKQIAGDPDAVDKAFWYNNGNTTTSQPHFATHNYFVINGVTYTLHDYGVKETQYSTSGQPVGGYLYPWELRTSPALKTWNRSFPLNTVDYFWGSNAGWNTYYNPIGWADGGRYAMYEGYFSLNQGTLSYWGDDLLSWMVNTTPVFSATDRVIDTGVKQYVFDVKNGVLVYLKDSGKVYAYGANKNGLSGVSGTLSTPARIPGPNNELTDLVSIGYDSYGEFFIGLKSDGTSVVWSGTNAYPISGISGNSNLKQLSMSTTKLGSFYTSPLIIGDDGKLYYPQLDRKNYKASLRLVDSGISNLYPPGYTPPVQLTTPLVSYSTVYDPYENATVTIDYGTKPEAVVHEYSLDAGATWLSYSSPFVLTQIGNVEIWARNGDGNGNYSTVAKQAINNNPIPTISPEYPKINFTKDANSGKTFTSLESGTTDSRVKMEISQDGITWNSYSTPVELSIGSHTIYARLLNSNQVEIVRKQQNYNVVDDTTPTAPVINQGSLDDNFKLPLTFTYDGTKGTLKYRIGGTWIDYTSGVVKVDNKQAIVDAKVVSSSGKESPVTSYTVSPVLPTVTSSNGTISIDINNFPNNTDLSIQYMDDVSATWTPYTGVITGLPDGDHTITVKLINSKTGAEFTESTVVNVNGNGSSGGGGTAPTAPPAGWGSPVGTEDVKLNVLSGGLTSTFQGVKLDNIVISTTDPYQQLNSVTNATIEDSRGTGKGWSYTLGVTDFVNDKAFDSSTGNNDLVVKMPSSALSVQVAKSQTLAGQDGNLSFPGNYVFGDKPITVAKAEAMQGMGQYNLGMDFTLRVPDTVEVVSTGSGSGYKSGEKTGLRVGTYRSVFTFTLTSGI